MQSTRFNDQKLSWVELTAAIQIPGISAPLSLFKRLSLDDDWICRASLNCRSLPGYRDLQFKEALHIQSSSKDNLLNRDRGAEIPGIWIAAVSSTHDNF